MPFLFDTHVHTDESSGCGKVTAADVVERYLSLGYDGICITDHMNKDNSAKYADTYDRQAEAFLKGYRNAREAAGDRLKVILGMEIRFLDNGNDYLVFGFDEKFVCDNVLNMFKNIREFRPFADENGLVIYQAHPFRGGMRIINPKYLDGIEVYNGHGGHNSANDIAYMWAQKFNLKMSSGSDFHYETGMTPGGILFDNMPDDSYDVAKMLKNGEYNLKTFVTEEHNTEL